jgi:hypothetical protein
MSQQSGRMGRLIERRRRRERMAGAALAALGVAVLVVAIIALRDPNSGHTVHPGSHIVSPAVTRTVTSTQQATSSPKSQSSSTSPPAQKLSLVVLNDTATTGLAKQAAGRFTDGGWPVASYANYTNPNGILSTCAYYDPSVSGAQASAEALRAQYPTIKRVVAQFASLAQYHSPIVVILTPDYSPN